MFDHETNLIISTVRERTIMKSPAVAVKDILAADIPLPLKRYFRTEVELRLANELNRLFTNSSFNWEHPEVKSLHNQINSILVLNYQFEKTEFQTMLDDAVHLLLNFLVRPQWTLKNFLFEKDESLSSYTIIRLLRYFEPYDYLKSLLVHYFHERHIESITRKEFSLLLWKLDSQFVKRKSGEELGQLFLPLYQFLDYPDNTNSNAVPTKALSKFCEDKGLQKVMIRLDGEDAMGTTTLTHQALISLLIEIRKTEGPFETEPTDENISIKDTTTDKEEQPQELKTKTQTTAVSMLSLFSDSDRKRIVKKVFLHNESAFFNTLQRIDGMTSWKEASAYVDEILINNEVDPYSNEAKRFMEILYQRFFPKKE